MLEFERPIAELEAKVEEMRRYAASENIDMGEEIAKLEDRMEKLKHDIYSNLTRWQKVQIARHPLRPHTLDYINLMMTDFVELYGDRYFADDPAIVGGPARIDGRSVMVIGHQKGRTTKENLYRNFGMPNPEGYRKAFRLMKLAAKFRLPVISLIDTPGAYPGIEAEERGQAEAIARNLYEMSHLSVPIIVTIIGEGGSGGALGIGVGDIILMMENSWYSVIAPESCSTILWRSKDKKEQSAESLRLTARDLNEIDVIDVVVPEPLGGAHRDYNKAAEILKTHIIESIDKLRDIPPDELTRARVEKFSNMGTYLE